MKIKNLLLLFLLVTLSNSITAQEQDLSPWTDNPYGNEWIDYSKKYVRVGITKDGMYKIPLATLRAKLGNDLNGDNVQAWFRGKQIALLIQDENVIFYGRKNDGVSDGLMFRPGPEARLDYTTSFFSEEGAHFFTKALGGDEVKRVTSINAQPSDGVPTETFHTENFIKTNSQFNSSGAFVDRRWPRDFAQLTDLSVSALNNSFFQSHNAFIKITETNVPLDESIQLPGFATGSGILPKLEYMVCGDGQGNREIELYSAAASENLNDLASRLSTFGINGFSYNRNTVSLIPGVNVSNTGEVKIRFRSTSSSVTLPSNSRNRYGYAYIKINYPQSLSFLGLQSKNFLFEQGVNGRRNIQIANVPSNIEAFDITVSDNPVLLNGSISGSTLNLGVDRITDRPYKLSLGILQIPDANVFDVKFDLLYSSYTGNAIDNVRPAPSNYDYLIVTHTSTVDKVVQSGAIEYGKYRAGSEGGAYNTLVISTRTIYDQFNYGEPSPIAIKRFANFMISNGIRSRHNILLVGHGVGHPSNIFKELPSDVPTFGNPGSDVLLVSGLSSDPNSNPDIPSIPIGRIPAYTDNQVMAYLNKVIEYERQTREESPSNLMWRRKLVNLIGIKKSDEITSFNNYVNDATNQIKETDYPWQVYDVSNASLVPPSGEFTRTDAPIDTYINSGIGMLGYYGHGNHEGTLYNIGTPKTRYNNSTIYPFVYITGCGVGDIYSSHSTQYPASDWLLVPNKGAIALLANTYLAYTNVAADYMEELYAQILGKSDSQRTSLGLIQKYMARFVILGTSNGRIAAATANEIANVHQTAIIGDPALRILLMSDAALPVVYKNFRGALDENDAVRLTWETSSEINNDYFVVERSKDGKEFLQLGTVKSKAITDEEAGHKYHFIDGTPVQGLNYYRLKQWDSLSEDGKARFSYSNIISVDFKKSSPLVIRPNPTTREITIISDKLSPNIEWQLFDNAGRLLLKGNKKVVELDRLSSGSYLLMIDFGNGVKETKQVIKL